MPGSPIHNPHDKLFKSSLKHHEVASEFLNLYLPESIKKELDFSTIISCPTEFIDKQLQLSQSDVLFKVMLAEKEAYIYVLAEHQSGVDKLMPFRLMQYMICIWNFHIKQLGEKKALPLPVIFPLVFFTGNSPYKGVRTLWELCGEHADSMHHILRSPFHLIDVSTLPEEELTSHVWAGTLGFILRKQFKKHLHDEIRKIATNLNTIGLEKQGLYLIELINYILNIEDEKFEVQDLINILHDKLSPGVEREIMSLAEKLRMEGELKGKLEGELKAKIDIAQRMLVDGTDPVFVAKVTKLPIKDVLKLQKNIN